MVPRSWIEEIKDSEFDKWFDEKTKAVYSPEQIETLRNCWQDSHDNTVLQYKEFIDECEDFLCVDFDIIDGFDANYRAANILKVYYMLFLTHPYN